MSVEAHLARQHAPLLLKKMGDHNLVEVVFANGGEELVTPARIKSDIQHALDGHNGRASLAQLQADVAVDEAATDMAMLELSRENAKIQRVEFGDAKELLTEAYLDSLAVEAGEMAARRGRVTFAELASTFNLSVDFVEQIIRARMADSSKHCPNKSTIAYAALVTDVYQQQKKTEILDVCSAATEPYPVEAIVKACGLSPEEADMAVKLLQSFIQSGELEGSCSGGRLREFVPKCFLVAQRKDVDAFFTANGYMDSSTAQKMQVCKFQSFVKESFPTAECLDTAVVSREVVEQLEAIADEAVAQGSWFEAWSVVPTALSDGDAARLVGMCAACKRAVGDPLRAIQLAEVYGASAKFVEDLVDRHRAEYSSKLHKDRADDTTSGVNMPLRKSGDKARASKRSSKGHSEEDTVSVGEACSFVISNVPELQHHVYFVSALGEFLLPRLREARTQAIQRFRERSLHNNALEQADDFETMFDQKYSRFQLCVRGLVALTHALRHREGVEGMPHPSSVPSTERIAVGQEDEHSAAWSAEDAERRAGTYLLRTRGAELADVITKKECSKLGVLFASQDSSEGRGPVRTATITKEASAALVEILPEDVGKALCSLWHAATADTEVSAFINILESQVFSACNLVGRRLGKRKERQLLAEGQQDLKETLFRSVSGQEVLHVGALLVFQNVLGALPLLPQPTLESTKPKIITDRQATEKLPQTKGNWARILLAAARGETMSEAEKALQKLQLELEGSETGCTVRKQNPALESVDTADHEKLTDQDAAPRGSGKDSAWRLLRSTEAARAAALALAE